MKALDSKLLKKFLKQAGDALKGKWLLVGGTLLPAVGLDVRSTVDIDLISLSEKEASQTLELMDLAQQLGLSVESINQAAAFFLKKLKYTDDDLIVLYQGKKATIYRPSIELYWKLKLQRLSESDLLDCERYYQFCFSDKDEINHKKLIQVIEAAKKRQATPEKLERLKILQKRVT